MQTVKSNRELCRLICRFRSPLRAMNSLPRSRGDRTSPSSLLTCSAHWRAFSSFQAWFSSGSRCIVLSTNREAIGRDRLGRCPLRGATEQSLTWRRVIAGGWPSRRPDGRPRRRATPPVARLTPIGWSREDSCWVCQLRPAGGDDNGARPEWRRPRPGLVAARRTGRHWSSQWNVTVLAAWRRLALGPGEGEVANQPAAGIARLDDLVNISPTSHTVGIGKPLPVGRR